VELYDGAVQLVSELGMHVSATVQLLSATANCCVGMSASPLAICIWSICTKCCQLSVITAAATTTAAAAVTIVAAAITTTNTSATAVYCCY
jgi:hypothetical protein